MSYRVKTENFEGPFDVLLYLVSRKQVDIGTIPIAQIADQYLEEVSRLSFVDLDVASDFLLVASTLLELKAASLVLRDKDETDEMVADLSPQEARALLVERLLEYKKFKNAAGMLCAREEAQARMHLRTCGPPPELTRELMPDFLRGVTLETLGVLAAGAFARRESALLDAEHIAAKPIPVEVYVRATHYRIMNEKHLRFSQLLEEDAPTPVVVVTFLAVLELYKRAMVDVRQSEAFGDIEITYRESSGELSFDEDDMQSAKEM